MEPAAVIPDSVEPYIGFKSVGIDDDGVLFSWFDGTKWPFRTKLTAHCREGHRKQAWKQVRLEVVEETKTAFREYLPDQNLHGWTLVMNFGNATNQTAIQLGSTSSFSFSTQSIAATAFTTTASNSISWLENFPPEEAPEPGYVWALIDDIEDEIVTENCSCGIYAGREPHDTLPFAQQSFNKALLRVALWGRVIIGTKGARGEFAYPQEVLSSPLWARSKLAENYGVPVRNEEIDVRDLQKEEMNRLMEALKNTARSYPSYKITPHTHSLGTNPKNPWWRWKR
jgi:hypothetical protein